MKGVIFLVGGRGVPLSFSVSKERLFLHIILHIEPSSFPGDETSVRNPLSLRQAQHILWKISQQTSCSSSCLLMHFLFLIFTNKKNPIKPHKRIFFY